MKIGVCLSGHYRTFDHNFSYWNDNVFSKYDCDVFLHTWNVMGNRKNGNDVDAVETMDRLTRTEEELKLQYNFTDAVIQDYNEPLAEFLEKSKRVRELRNNIVDERYAEMLKKRRITHLYSMWYKALKCFQLTEKTNTQYDLIIRSRPDIAILDTFTLDEVDPMYINWPRYSQGWFLEPHDYFAIGNYENMKIYNNLYNRIEDMESILEIDKRVFRAGDGYGIPGIERFLNPHTLLYLYIEEMKIPNKIITNYCSITRG
jgi:hypothetical protein